MTIFFFALSTAAQFEVAGKLGRAGGSSFSIVELPVNTEGNALERKEPELQKIIMRIAGL